jgi:ribosomal protein L11 methyltransferase
MSKSYVELRIVADQSLREKLIGVMSQLGIEGFWEDEAVLKCYVRSERWRPEMLNELQQIASMVARSSRSILPKISTTHLEEQNWNEEWEKTIQPIQVTNRIVIKPTWQEYKASPDQIVLTIDPKMAFGTGYHETTRLCLKVVEQHIRPGMCLLDVGTGTGVLAIAAAKLGAKLAVGVDNDEWSYVNAVENVRLNHIEERVRIIHGKLSSVGKGKFDIITANIQRNIIEPLLNEMKNKLVESGMMILSGLLFPDKEPIGQRLSALRFEVCEELMENEWIALVVHSRRIV